MGGGVVGGTVVGGTVVEGVVVEGVVVEDVVVGGSVAEGSVVFSVSCSSTTPTPGSLLGSTGFLSSIAHTLSNNTKISTSTAIITNCNFLTLYFLPFPNGS